MDCWVVLRCCDLFDLVAFASCAAVTWAVIAACEAPGISASKPARLCCVCFSFHLPRLLSRSGDREFTAKARPAHPGARGALESPRGRRQTALCHLVPGCR